jgi:hypothetical protein
MSLLPNSADRRRDGARAYMRNYRNARKMETTDVIA